MFYWLHKTHIGGRSYSSTTVNLLDFYTNKTEQHLHCRLLGLDKTSNVAYNSGETQTCNYCSVEIDSGEILASVWRELEKGNFAVLKRCCIQIYPISVLLCFGKAVNLQHM